MEGHTSWVAGMAASNHAYFFFLCSYTILLVLYISSVKKDPLPAVWSSSF